MRVPTEAYAPPQRLRPWKQVDLARHAALLIGAVECDAAVALIDASGDEVFGISAHDGSDAGAAVLALRDAWPGSDPARGLSLCSDGRGREALLLHRAIEIAGDRLGWLVLLLPERVEGDALARVEHLLGHVADGLRCECELRLEADELAAELSDRHEELNVAYEVPEQHFVLDLDPQGATRFLHGIVERLRVDFAAFVTVDGNAPVWAIGEGMPLAGLDFLVTELRGTLLRYMRVARKPMVVNEPDDPRRPLLLANRDLRLIAVPVADGTRLDAMLVLARRPDRPHFTNGDRKLATLVADQTSLVMRNRSMIGSLRRFSEQMAHALIAAIEAKDPYTRGHSERVETISVALARAAELIPEDVENISWGALLHDVGKIGVPDSIICKRGRLTEDEYTLIKTHPETSYEIMRHIDYFSQQSLDAARYHQEKYDGTGYPYGLRGDQIPMHARVIAVGDTYDAMTSSRSYRAGLAHEVAVAEIEECAGIQLDPRFAEIFLRLCESKPEWLAPTRAQVEDGD